MELDVQQPSQVQSDKVFEHINDQQTLPLSMSFIPSLLELTKQTWVKPSSVPQISCKVENLYKTHGDNTAFLFKHPPPNSLIVDAIPNRARNRSSTTPNNKEGKKLDIVGHRIYSLASFILRTANYTAAMGAYHHYLWNKAFPSLQSATGKCKCHGLTYHQEAMGLAHQERICLLGACCSDKTTLLAPLSIHF